MVLRKQTCFKTLICIFKSWNKVLHVFTCCRTHGTHSICRSDNHATSMLQKMVSHVKKSCFMHWIDVAYASRHQRNATSAFMHQEWPTCATTHWDKTVTHCHALVNSDNQLLTDDQSIAWVGVDQFRLIWLTMWVNPLTNSFWLT